MDCIFCKIISREIPSEIIYENETVIAFNDISPAAPVHILIVPKKHLASVNDITLEDKDLSVQMLNAAKEIARIKNISEEGYRLIINNGGAAGQVVFHLHMHILGGRQKLGPMLSKQ